MEEARSLGEGSGASARRSPPPDFVLGKKAVESGMVTAAQLEECLRLQASLREKGESVLLREILLRRNLLSSDDLSRLVKIAGDLAEAGAPVARYPIESRLGEGASAIVYRAWDRDLNRPVALKILRERHGPSDVWRERFRREARAAGGLVHPNLITVFDAGEENGQLYLVMELVEGKALSQFWEGGRGELREKVALLEKVARAVAAAHAKGIIHRDLKPQNILVTPSAEPKVGDFGLAHLTDAGVELTRSGATLGTPIYMAPEQVTGRSRDVSPRTDVYALGAILYEGLTGQPPHSGETLMDLYGKITRDEPPAPRRMNRKISPELEAVVLKALEKNPQRRYRDAGEFADDLARFLSGEAVLARPLPGLLYVWRRARKHRTAILTAALAALIPIGILATRGVEGARRSRAVRLALRHSSEAEGSGRIAEARDGYRSVLALDPDSSEARAGFDRTDRAWQQEQRDLSEKVKHQEEALRVLKAISVESCRGRVAITVGTQRAAAVEGQELRASHGVETGEESGAVVRYLDSTRVELGPRTTVTKFRSGSSIYLAASEEAKTVVLASGSASLDVARQPQDRPLLLSTSLLEVRTEEGRFSVAVGPASTRIEVREGRLQVKRLKDGRLSELTGGEALNVVDGP